MVYLAENHPEFSEPFEIGEEEDLEYSDEEGEEEEEEEAEEEEVGEMLDETSILNKRRVISLPYKQRALSGSIGEKLKEKMGHKLMIGSHYSYE